MFDKVCDYAIREKLEKGEKVPTTIEEMKELRKHMTKKFLPPVSFRQFSNACSEIANRRQDSESRLGALSQRLTDLNGNKDPFNKTLVIIDEVHKFFAKDLHFAEKANFDVIEEEMNYSYKESKKDSVRLLMMSATPIMDTPMDFIKLINLITPKGKLPVDGKEFMKKFPTNDQFSFTKDSKDKLQEYFKAKISFLDRRYDPRLFVQPVFHDVHVKLGINEDGVKMKCDEKLKGGLENCKKTKVDDIARCESNKPGDIENETKKDEENIKKLEKEMNDVASKVKKGKMDAKKPFQAKIKTLKQGIKIRQSTFKKKVKEYKTCLSNSAKSFDKCENKANKDHKKCMKDDQKITNTLDNLKGKCKISENEFS